MPQRSRGSTRYINLALCTSHNALGIMHVSQRRYNRVYNGGSQILSSSKHSYSYCRWYKLRPWPLRKRPSAIVPQRSRGSQGYPQLGIVHVSKQRYTRVYNDVTQILSSLKHSYLRWYNLRPWPLRKLPSAIGPQRCRESKRYLNLALCTSHNADIPEYIMAVLKY